MQAFVNWSIDQGIATLTLSRPEKRNALTRDFILQIDKGISQISQESSVRVLRILAEGKAFCAGMDLGEMQQRAQSANGASEWQKDSEVYARLLTKLFQLPIPTVVGLQGPVLAGGVGLVLACDMIVSTESSFFMLPEPMRGITAAIVTPLLLFRVGPGVATQMLLSGDRFSANRCHELGLVYKVCQTDGLSKTVDSLTQSILTGSQAALEITKKHLHQSTRFDVCNQLSESIEVSATARGTADAREGLAAFLEKREPSWKI